MAERNKLHKRQLANFKRFLDTLNATYEEPSNDFEVLRARLPNRKHPVIIYQTLPGIEGVHMGRRAYQAKEHLTLMSRDLDLWRDFLSWRQDI